jgi:hypothetical protein
LNAVQQSGDPERIRAAKLALNKLPQRQRRDDYYATDEDEAKAVKEAGEDFRLGAEDYVGVGDSGLADLQDKRPA